MALGFSVEDDEATTKEVSTELASGSLVEVGSVSFICGLADNTACCFRSVPSVRLLLTLALTALVALDTFFTNRPAFDVVLVQMRLSLADFDVLAVSASSTGTSSLVAVAATTLGSKLLLVAEYSDASF